MYLRSGAGANVRCRVLVALSWRVSCFLPAPPTTRNRTLTLFIDYISQEKTKALKTEFVVCDVLRCELTCENARQSSRSCFFASLEIFVFRIVHLPCQVWLSFQKIIFLSIFPGRTMATCVMVNVTVEFRGNKRKSSCQEMGVTEKNPKLTVRCSDH